jgi:hypothetical protein
MLLSLPVTVDRSIAFFTNKKKLADAEDAKKVHAIRIRKSQKDRQYNGKKRTNDNQWSTKHYTQF